MAGGSGGGVNAKSIAGKAKKAENEVRKQSATEKQREIEEAVLWSDGANTKRNAKVDAAAAKADENARKRQEKAALLAAEEAALGSGGAAVSAAAAAPKLSKVGKNNKKPKNDLQLLEESLIKAADNKVKKKKEETAARLAAEAKSSAATVQTVAPIDPLLANTETMIGAVTIDDTPLVGRPANVARMQDDVGGSGIDAALNSLGISKVGDMTTLKSAKALYNDFEQRMLPIVKEEHPGLRLSQYKERVWNLWKKSPENPSNQIVTTDAAASR